VDDAEAIRASYTHPEAFGEIFERHYRVVLGYSVRRTGVAVGEDIASRTFVIAFEQRKRFNTAAASARPWLMGIATNLIRHHFRDEATHLAVLQRLPPERSDGDVTDEHLEAVRLGPTLVEELLALDPVDRDAFLLLALGELTYDEIGAALGIPTGTVRSKLHRARRRLRERLDLGTAIE
jgi:RNA polymerase sigma-70 factor (ECF subfamily)